MSFTVETMRKVNYEPFGTVNVKHSRYEAASELQLNSVHAGCIRSTDYDHHQILVDQLTICPVHTEMPVSYVCIRMVASNAQMEAKTSASQLYADVIRCLQDTE